VRPERRGGRVAATAIALLTARRAVRSAVPWGVVFGMLIANEALAYRSSFPTRASRQQLAETFGRNDALASMVGPARRLDTVGGFLAWRVFGLLILVGAVWGLLTATRLLRGEEDAGRWELLLAARPAPGPPRRASPASPAGSRCCGR
jgi:ABC-2 type transport system permease protein